MRGRLTRIVVLALLSLSTTGYLCLPHLPAPADPYSGPAPVGSFNPTAGLSVSTTAPGAAADLTFSMSVPAGHQMAAGVSIILPAAWGVAADASVPDGVEVGAVNGTFTATNDYLAGGSTCATTADFSTPLLEATTDTAAPAYPAFLSVLAPGTHRARYQGLADVEGLADVAVNVLVDRLGDGRHQIVVIAGDPTVVAAYGAERMCTPWSFTLTLRGTSLTGGHTVYSNPTTAGAYNLFAVLASERDADLDGAGNGQDMCPMVASATQPDSDVDFIGDACDPAPTVQQLDYDADTIPNGFDNCAMAANPTQTDGDRDDLGDACDAAPTVADGARHVLKCERDVFIGTAGSDTVACAPLTQPVGTPTPTPTPGPDADGDGCSDNEENGPNHALGGQRDMNDYWDFYDVNGSRSIDLQDTLAVLQHFGHSYNGGMYVDATDDRLDRSAPSMAMPWLSEEANDGVDLVDALANLKSFGDSCAGPP